MLGNTLSGRLSGAFLSYLPGCGFRAKPGPECDGPHVVDLADIFHSPGRDYFRCADCLGWWTVPENEHGPATRISFGDLAATDTKKAG